MGNKCKCNKTPSPVKGKGCLSVKAEKEGLALKVFCAVVCSISKDFVYVWKWADEMDLLWNDGYTIKLM